MIIITVLASSCTKYNNFMDSMYKSDNNIKIQNLETTTDLKAANADAYAFANINLVHIQESHEINGYC